MTQNYSLSYKMVLACIQCIEQNTSTEISDSTKVLIASFSANIPADCQLKAKRVKSTVRAAYEAEVNDILALFNHVDGQSALDGVEFVVAAVDRLPGVDGPEDINLCAITDRQSRTDAVVSNLAAFIATMTMSGTDGAAVINGVTEAISKMDDKLRDVTQGIQKLIDQLMTCGKLVDMLESSAL